MGKRNNRQNNILTWAAKIIAIFAAYVVAFQLQRMIFFCIYNSGEGTGGLGASAWHGTGMDFAMAGYLTAIPFIITLVELWMPGRTLRAILNIYFAITSIMLGICLVADPVLFSYWNVRLDAMPVFYFTSSPSAAMASAKPGEIAGGAVGILAVAAALFFALYRINRQIPSPRQPKALPAAATAVALAIILFVCIRGGVTVSTMNVSNAYFSDNEFLNQTAVNPAFSLLYSLAHQDDFNKARYYDEKNLAEILDRLRRGSVETAPNDTLPLISFKTERPDIFIIILESFSNGLFPSLGGEPVALGLDSIAREGILFDNFYATGMRTDRGIPAILSGFPGTPEVSVMKYVNKAAKLNGIASELSSKAGYEATYYYGGDADFTNMKAYLFNTGYGRIVSDRDFPISERLSKWGAHDDKLFEKVLTEYKELPVGAPAQLITIQTSSSHEPFDVPYSNPKFAGNPKANAFAFTDREAAAFIRQAMQTERGRNALFVLTGDHWGAYPESVAKADIFTKHHVPLILAGGFLEEKGKRVSRTASQTDIPATILALTGTDSDAFPFSSNLADPHSAAFAWMYTKDEIGIITPQGETIYNIRTDKNVYGNNTDAAKGILQSVYITLSSL